MFTLSARVRKRSRAARVSAFVLALLGHQALAQAQSPPSAAQSLERIRAAHKFDSLALRREKAGSPPLELTAGKVAGDRIFPIGSVSKSITGICVATLIQDGKLRLDSKLGDVLPPYLAKKKVPFDASLNDITIARLLAHRAGLRPNGVTDTSRGLRSRDVTDKVGGTPHFLTYITTANAFSSSGSEDYLYSNLSYIVLGLVIEAVSGEDYQVFCRRKVFEPLGVKSASVPSHWNIVAPFGGWRMTQEDLLEIWRVLDVTAPTMLTADTLSSTLLGKFTPPTRPAGNIYYTLGVYVRHGDAGSYVLSHNGLAGYVRRVPTGFTFVEKIVPGDTWVVSASPAPRDEDLGKVTREVASEIRTLLKEATP